jgi:hypothetical protein
MLTVRVWMRSALPAMSDHNHWHARHTSRRRALDPCDTHSAAPSVSRVHRLHPNTSALTECESSAPIAALFVCECECTVWSLA